MPRILTFTSGPEDWRERAATRQMFRQVLVSLDSAASIGDWRAVTSD